MPEKPPFDPKDPLWFDKLSPEEKQALRELRPKKEPARETASPQDADAAEPRRAFENLQQKLHALIEERKQEMEDARGELRSVQRHPIERTMIDAEPASTPTNENIAAVAARLREAVARFEEADLARHELEHTGAISESLQKKLFP